MKSYLFILAFLPSICWSQKDFSMTNKRGSFSAALPISYLATGVMNSDGSMANYKGYLYGLGLDVNLLNFDPSEIRVFGTYLLGEATGSSSAEKLKRTETFVGVKFYPAPWIFLGAGAGRSMNKVSRTNVGDVSLNSSISGIGSGLEFNLADGWFLSLSAWYKSGAIKQNENSSLGNNSFNESLEIQMQIVWSPFETILNFNKSKK